MSRPNTTSSTTGACQPGDVLHWIEGRLRISRMSHAEFVADPVFGLIMTGHQSLVAENVFYIGLGDEFDDDRRLVREIPPHFARRYVPIEPAAWRARNSTTE